ncbi:uncharacterized protein PHALS_11155 [Plasmopara halstedii]|uniref:Uncharacterized protein n=1 Tax=Plasmopara halstedii TaxID=4781 RepID=A0A0P1AII7_PLAHL|nr:uncharacterized protein PHALS_11155 [Plasmopara halstedii]CEG40982.1 hypothetical protein PHALS_11155 [Plasmopara halstedii]|eukprot:XP_024577351.1 hypothetical protein PHALS_11155 [Plasmopara halstedii]
MITSSANVGIDFNEKVTFHAPKLSSSLSQNDTEDDFQRSTNTLTDFMYQTTSGAFGNISQTTNRSRLSQRMDKLTVQKEVKASDLVVIRQVDVVTPESCAIRPEDLMPTPIDVKAITEGQNQHPLYVTSYRDIGADKAQLKVDAARLGRPNTFTNSFNGFHYRDFGLNTAVSKSRICDQLDFT